MRLSAFPRHRLFYLVLLGALISLWGRPAQPSYASGLAASEQIITFARLGADEKSLRGPFDSTYIDFSLPANWELRDGAQLQLQLSTFFAEDTGSATDASITGSGNSRSFGGMLQVALNNVTLGTVLL